MLTSEEISYLQGHIDNNMVDRLSETAQIKLEQGFRDGVLEDKRNWISEYSNPRYTEDFPEVERALNMPTDPREAQEYIDRLSEPKDAWIPGMREMNASLSLPVVDKYKGSTIQTDKYGNPIVVTREGESRYLNAPGFSRGDIPRIAKGALNLVEEVAPYLGGSGIVRQAPGLLVKTGQALPGSGFKGFAQQFSPRFEVAARPTMKTAIAGQGAIGVTVETGDQLENLIHGEEAQWERVATTPMWAMAGELGGQLLGRAISAGVNKYLNKPATYRILNDDGTFTKQAVADLKAQTKTPEELHDEIRAEILARIKKGELTERQLESWERFNEYNLNPTRAQVTRDPGEFHTQNELNRNQDPFTRQRLAEQEQIIQGHFEGRIDSAGGELNTPRQAVINKQSVFDNEIGALYNRADEIAMKKGGFNVGEYYRWLETQVPQNDISGGAVKSLMGNIQDMVSGAPGKTLQERLANTQFDAKDIEFIRQAINRKFGGASQQARIWINQSKFQLDDTLFKDIGKEIYGESRSLFNTYSQSLKRTKVDKYDIKGKDIITDIRADDQFSNADYFMRKIVANSAYTAKDIRQLKEFMRTGVGTAEDAQIAGMGLDAWKTVRKDTLEWIMAKAQPVTNARTGGDIDLIPFNSAKLHKALNDIGWDKLKVIFSVDEVKFLRDMNLILADMKAPVMTQASPSGPAIGLAKNQFMALLAKMPSVFGRIAEGAINQAARQIADTTAVSGARVLVGGPSRVAQEAVRQIPQLGRPFGAGGAITGTQLGRDDR